MDSSVDRPESVAPTRIPAAACPGSSGRPLTVMTPTGRAEATVTAIRATDGVTPGRAGEGWTEISVLASAPPQTPAETRTAETLRDQLDGSPQLAIVAYESGLVTPGAP
ncbi:hypothetical protein [Streptomyces sp. NPDC005017]|uniref:hypothetical protein n=1 Tax=Streptomyces sp. NPDC005017 TaxID=3364706 RepID=UPI00369B23DB